MYGEKNFPEVSNRLYKLTIHELSHSVFSRHVYENRKIS